MRKWYIRLRRAEGPGMSCVIRLSMVPARRDWAMPPRYYDPVKDA